jgi:hypothetical protein
MRVLGRKRLERKNVAAELQGNTLASTGCCLSPTKTTHLNGLFKKLNERALLFLSESNLENVTLSGIVGH